MLQRLITITAIAVLFATGGAQADVLDGTDRSVLTDSNAPQRGMSMAKVESNWGAPAAKRAAIGQPPISRWQYDGFVVYFEYDKVIHTVMQRN
ncbi:MAG: hypothetical protein AAF004_11345 [Pseudomonadota bacterium]